MNWDTLSGQWKQFRGKAKERWGKLTDDDLDVANGRFDQLVGRVQERYGVAKDAAEREVKEWSDKLGPEPVRSTDMDERQRKVG